ncbi:MAG: sulfatase [Deltaproteobacteria bacterium]|nr:sulfatase [Deltaproteobacteria bacterium]
MASQQLNIVLVVLGGVRADHLSCYGYSRPTTPFLDQVAREGVRFQRSFATASWSLPSHASLFTGLFPSSHGATDEHLFLAPRHALLPECLKAVGYRTAIFSTDTWVSPATGFARGVDHFDTQRLPNPILRRAQNYRRAVTDRLLRRADAGARRTNQALLRWVGNSDQPFFAFVHYNEVGLRAHLPRPYDKKFLPQGVSEKRVHSITQRYDESLCGCADMTEEEIAILTARYDNGLAYVDFRAREIAEALQRGGRWDDTLFIVTADHGEDLGAHRKVAPSWGLYDTQVRVPLIVRCPSVVPQGFVVEEFAQSCDTMPTVLGLAGVADGARRMQGRPLIAGGRATPGPAFVVSEQFRPNLAALRRAGRADARPYDVRKKAIRTIREKFIWHSDEANEFYDLTADPGETHNLIDREGGRADALRKQLFDWLAQLDKFEGEESVSREMGGLVREQLRGLGHVA